MKKTKIIYIAIGSYHALPGVRSKLKAKVEALNNKLNGRVHGLYFCNDVDEVIEEGNLKYVPFSFKGKIPKIWSKRVLWRFQEHYVRRKKFAIIKEEMKSYPDCRLILFRYTPSDLNLLAFTLSHFKKIIFEHNSIEKKDAAFYPDKTVGAYYSLGEKLLGPFVRMAAKAMIAVTQEIRDYEKRRSFFMTESLVVSNGISLDAYQKIEVKKFKSATEDLHVIFTSGYSNVWHGVDLLIKSMRGRNDVHLHLVGEFDEGVHSLINEGNKDKIRFYGKLEGKAYEEVFEKVHVGVSSLAMYRTGLKEGSVLKSREYASRSVPFILGHEDYDFKDEEITPFIYRVDVDEDNLINFDEVKAFLLNLSNKDYSLMRNYAEKVLSYEAKADAYKAIIEA